MSNKTFSERNYWLVYQKVSVTVIEGICPVLVLKADQLPSFHSSRKNVQTPANSQSRLSALSDNFQVVYSYTLINSKEGADSK